MASNEEIAELREKVSGAHEEEQSLIDAANAVASKKENDITAQKLQKELDDTNARIAQLKQAAGQQEETPPETAPAAKSTSPVSKSAPGFGETENEGDK